MHEMATLSANRLRRISVSSRTREPWLRVTMHVHQTAVPDCFESGIPVTMKKAFVNASSWVKMDAPDRVVCRNCAAWNCRVSRSRKNYASRRLADTVARAAMITPVSTTAPPISVIIDGICLIPGISAPSSVAPTGSPRVTRLTT